ncbi:MAG: VOC family protein, partial [Hyphomonadaceae bacterium]|nr:VOC family protein [Hyphomonadaceae bacterium]
MRPACGHRRAGKGVVLHTPGGPVHARIRPEQAAAPCLWLTSPDLRSGPVGNPGARTSLQRNGRIFGLTDATQLPEAPLKNTLTTCLWLNAEAEEALQLYTSLLPNSRMGAIQRPPADSSFGTKKGDVMAASAT